MTFDERLRYELLARGWKTGKLRYHLVCAGLIVSQNTVRNWAKGKSVPKLEHAVFIARVLETSLDALCGLDVESVSQDAAKPPELPSGFGSAPLPRP